jgi:lysophospholipase L1-like esterase
MEKMNSIAADIMMENRIRINDLHSEAQPILKTMQGKDGCHFNGEGYQVLGKAVANTIARQLSLPPAP